MKLGATIFLNIKVAFVVPEILFSSGVEEEQRCLINLSPIS